MFGFNNSNVVLERDPVLQKLQQSIDEQLSIIAKEDNIDTKNEQIQFVSFEQALRELANTKNS